MRARTKKYQRLNSHSLFPKIRYSHIKTVPANLKGRDFVIGDVHGALRALRKVVGLLKPGDRLFLVGDLIDRGPHSIEVIKLIRRHSKQIFSVRGNHEDMCLNAISALEVLFKALKPRKPHADYLHEDNLHRCLEDETIKLHYDNGGEWLVTTFLKELSEGKIRCFENKITYHHSDIQKIKQTLLRLPYIMHVKGHAQVKPFNVVHADMPFNDFELLTRIDDKNFQLTRAEKNYANYSRTKDFKDWDRDETSILTYCGHNIVYRPENTLSRRQVNVINLDVAAFENHHFLVVIHSDKDVCWVLTPTSPRDLKSREVNKELLCAARLHLNEALKMIPQRLRQI